MSKKEDNDKAKMSQCEKKLMVIQGIKDRSVTRKQGCGDEGETEKDPEMGVRGKMGRSRGDPGKIHRSCGGSVFRSVRGEGGGE